MRAGDRMERSSVRARCLATLLYEGSGCPCARRIVLRFYGGCWKLTGRMVGFGEDVLDVQSDVGGLLPLRFVAVGSEAMRSSDSNIAGSSSIHFPRTRAFNSKVWSVRVRAFYSRTCCPCLMKGAREECIGIVWPVSGSEVGRDPDRGCDPDVCNRFA